MSRIVKLTAPYGANQAGDIITVSDSEWAFKTAYGLKCEDVEEGVGVTVQPQAVGVDSGEEALSPPTQLTETTETQHNLEES